MKKIDTRGKDCPQPVIMTKKAIENNGNCQVIVDNEAARENVTRMANSKGCSVEVEKKDGSFYINIVNGGSKNEKREILPQGGSTLLVIGGETMGRGSDELGTALMKAFFHTINEISPKPDAVILFNSGVKLAVKGSPVLEDLRLLEKGGTRIMVCGTCLDYFSLKESIGAGTVSNMYDIAETMFSAEGLVRI